MPQTWEQIVYHPTAETAVFVTESGAVGIADHGRLAIHTIAAWVALSWGDVPERTRLGVVPPAEVEGTPV